MLSFTCFSKGIVFENASWKAVLSKAKETGKPIFVDVYTTWCAPCKSMSETIFPREDVGKVFSDHFISYQIDAEKGEGVNIASSYSVRGYPAFLFIRPDGSLFAQRLGTISAPDFINFAKQVLSVYNDGRTIEKVERDYKKNKKDTALLFLYMTFRKVNRMSNAELFDEYLKLLPEQERASDQVANLYRRERYTISVNSFACENLLKNRAALNPKLNNQAEFYLKDFAVRSFKEAAQSSDLALLDRAIMVYGEDPPTPLNYLKDYFYMDFYISKSNPKNFIEFARRYYGEYLIHLTPGSKSNQMPGATIASLFRNGTSFVLKKISDPTVLKEAIQWSKRAEEVAPQSKETRFITYNLMYKSGEKEAAKKLLASMLTEFSNPNDKTLQSYRETLKKMFANEQTW